MNGVSVRSNRWSWRPVARAWLVVAVLTLATSAAAQPGQGIETDPIRCWWKTDRTAVHIGERFGLTLTCSVIETASTSVVPATSQLDPGAIQLAPFEVVGGIRHDDVVSLPWRYLQYDYTLRLLGEGFFAQDVTIPPLAVTYNIKAASGNGAQGRDQQYNLPPIQMRLLSIVPKAANDIRDASTETFAAIEARRFRARAAFVGATVFFGFAGLLLALALVRVVGRARKRRSAVDRPLPSALVLNGCLRALHGVKSEAAQEGWSPALARRALAPVRVAGAVALERPIPQSPGSRDMAQRDGQLALRSGLLRPKRSVVSAATTAEAIDRHLSNGFHASARQRALLERLRDSLRVLSTAGYGRNTDVDTIALDSALENGSDAIKELRFRSLWPMRIVDSVARSFFGL